MLSFERRQDWLRVQTQVLSALLGVLLLVAGTGCDAIATLGEDDDAPNFSEEISYQRLSAGSVNLEEIDQGQYGSLFEGTQKVIRDDGEYALFWGDLHANQDPTPEAPEVNFDEEIVIAIVLGERPTGGYNVKVDEILVGDDGKEVQVQYTEQTPGDGCNVTQAITSPYVLVTVEKQGGDFTFSGSEDVRQC